MSGYRTYLIAAAMAIVTALYSLGYIDRAVYEAILGFLGSGGLVTLRAGIKNDTKASDGPQ